MTRRAALAVLCLALGLLPRSAAALGSTLSETAAALGDALGDAVERAPERGALALDGPVGLAVSVTVPGWPERGGRLVTLLRGLLVEQVEQLQRRAGAPVPRVVLLGEPAAPGGGGDAGLDAARALAAAEGAPLVVLVEVTVTEGHLALRATLARGARSFWERALGGGEGVLATAFARARLDVELRTLLDGPVQPSQLAPRLGPLRTGGARLPAPVVALAVCDVDADGRDDVAVLGRDELVVLSAAGATRLPLSAMPAAEAPSRVPYGALVPLRRPDGTCRLALGTSDRGGLALVERGAGGGAEGAALSVRPVAAPGALLGGAPTEGADAVLLGTAEPGKATLRGPLQLWSPADGPRPLGETAPAGGWEERATVRRPEAGAVDVYAVRRTAGGAVTVSAASRVTRRAWPLGPRGALLVADLDDDGAPECVATSTALPPAEDRLELLRLGDGSARPAWATAAPPVRALAAGDPDDDGALEVVLAVDVAGDAAGHAPGHSAEAPGAPASRLLLLELRGARGGRPR